MNQPLPVLPHAGTQVRKTPTTEPAPPLWLSLLEGVSRWLNRLFLGLVLALVVFTFWHWWQG